MVARPHHETDAQRRGVLLVGPPRIVEDRVEGLAYHRVVGAPRPGNVSPIHSSRIAATSPSGPRRAAPNVYRFAWAEGVPGPELARHRRSTPRRDQRWRPGRPDVPPKPPQPEGEDLRSTCGPSHTACCCWPVYSCVTWNSTASRVAAHRGDDRGDRLTRLEVHRPELDLHRPRWHRTCRRAVRNGRMRRARGPSSGRASPVCGCRRTRARTTVPAEGRERAGQHVRAVRVVAAVGERAWLALRVGLDDEAAEVRERRPYTSAVRAAHHASTAGSSGSDERQTADGHRRGEAHREVDPDAVRAEDPRPAEPRPAAGPSAGAPRCCAR